MGGRACRTAVFVARHVGLRLDSVRPSDAEASARPRALVKRAGITRMRFEGLAGFVR